MLSFAEFFTKKKIDINALQQGMPDLYQEFDRDYALMGEKSFDHSKKFWFNRLRKEYLLQEIEITETKKVEPKQEVSTNPSTTTSTSTAAKPAGFRPKFKATSVAAQADKTSEEPKESVEIPVVKAPSGFKPRFKAATPPEMKDGHKEVEQEKKSTEAVNSTGEASDAPAKPKGFTPRFKASNIPKKVDAEASETNPVNEPEESAKAETPNIVTDQSDVTPAKPKGFTPRFKASNIPKKVDAEANETNPVNEPEESAKVETSNIVADQSDVTPAKPKGFTPRFKASNIPKKVDAEANETNPVNEPDETSKAETSNIVTDQSDVTPAKPKGFTPRFKAGMTKTNTNQEEKETHPEQSTAPSEEPSTNTTAKPVGFKPRFVPKKPTDQKENED